MTQDQKQERHDIRKQLRQLTEQYVIDRRFVLSQMTGRPMAKDDEAKVSQWVKEKKVKK